MINSRMYRKKKHGVLGIKLPLMQYNNRKEKSRKELFKGPIQHRYPNKNRIFFSCLFAESFDSNSVLY